MPLKNYFSHTPVLWGGFKVMERFCRPIHNDKFRICFHNCLIFLVLNAGTLEQNNVLIIHIFSM